MEFNLNDSSEQWFVGYIITMIFIYKEMRSVATFWLIKYYHDKNL